MIDFYFFKIDTSTFIFIVSAIIFLATQLLLCFKGKCIWVKLIPVFLSVTAIIVFLILTACLESWDAVGALVLALFSAYLLAVSICGLGIWGIVLLIRKLIKKD